jgi:hypothetical protein
MDIPPAEMELIIKREIDCKIQRRALDMWLGMLTPVRWLTVIGATVLSAVAGATILQKPLGSRFGVVVGVCALVASILSALHTALHCDAHQADCRRLISDLRGLESEFEDVRVRGLESLGMELRELDKSYKKAISESVVLAPAYFRRRAERERSVKRD